MWDTIVDKHIHRVNRNLLVVNHRLLLIRAPVGASGVTYHLCRWPRPSA